MPLEKSDFSAGDPLDGRAGIFNEHLKVGLVPLAGLWRRLEGIGLATEFVKANGAGVAGAVRLATRFNPDKSVGPFRVNIGSRARAETSIDNIAPVTPLKTATRVSGATCVNDGVTRHTGRFELRAEKLKEELLVLCGVVLRIWIIRKLTWSQIPAISC